MSIRSYVRSTDVHRKPCGKNIFPSVDVPVDVFSTALGAIPTANIQRQFIHYKPTIKVAFTARKKSVNLDQCSPVPFTLIFKLTKHFRPCSIGDGSSQFAITNHISDRRVFNSYQAVRTNQISGQLVQKISTSIADSEAVSRVLATLCAYALHFGVYLSYFKSCFISVIRAWLFSDSTTFALS